MSWRRIALVLSSVQLPQCGAQPPERASDIATEIQEAATTLSGWPPLGRLRSVDRETRDLWRSRLTVSYTTSATPTDSVLTVALIEVLAEAAAFDDCGLGYSEEPRTECYSAWLRYHVGAGVTMEQLGRTVGDYLADSPMAPARFRGGQGGQDQLSAVVYRSELRLRERLGHLFPAGPVHDSIVVVASPTGVPVYGGTDLAGRPVLQLPPGTSAWATPALDRVVAHEIWPGHHLLMTSGYPAQHPLLSGYRWAGYDEGWTTYVESFVQGGPATGRFEVHLSRLALLTMVDIGLNARGRSGEWAVKALQDGGGYSHARALSAVREVRSTPGRAAAYLLGYEVFKRLRCAEVGPGEATLGAFHRELMSLGPLPLAALVVAFPSYSARFPAPSGDDGIGNLSLYARLEDEACAA